MDEQIDLPFAVNGAAKKPRRGEYDEIDNGEYYQPPENPENLKLTHEELLEGKLKTEVPDVPLTGGWRDTPIADRQASCSIRITLFEAIIAGMCGVLRSLVSRLCGYKSSGFVENRELNDVYAAIAEYAVAKCINSFMTFSNNWLKKVGIDIAPDIGVRYTEHKSGYLIIQPYDRLKVRYVLVRGPWWDLEVVGWIWRHEMEESWLTRQPKGNMAYNVYPIHLHPVHTIKDPPHKCGGLVE